MENNMSDNAHDQIYEVTNRASRSMIAVIDTMTQRGAFKGEELSTIGHYVTKPFNLHNYANSEHKKQQPKLNNIYHGI